MLMMKIKLKPIEIITLILILMALVGLFYVIYNINNQGLECINNPLSFFQNKTDSTCYCFNNKIFGTGLK